MIVLGYPHLFPASATEQGCGKLRKFTTRLNGVIADAATAEGIQFEDVTDDFDGHEICGALGEWINGYSASKKSLRDDESFHPDLDGQTEGYSSAIQSALTK